MSSTFVTTAGPPGWKLGRWTQLSPTSWQEQKLDDPKAIYQFQVVNGPKVPGSSTVRLKMRDQNTEVLLLTDTIQVFANAGYLGEYVGQWQGGGAPQARAAAPAGYAPARQSSQQGAQPLSFEEPKFSAAAPVQKSAPPPNAGRSRQGPGAPPQADFERTSLPENPPTSSSQPQKAQLDKSPQQIQKLCDAAKNGDVQGVSRLIADGVDPDGAAKDGKTALMAATSGGHLRVVEALLAAGADPNVGKGPETPMTIAFEKGKTDILKVLFGASFNNLNGTVTATSTLRGGTPACNIPRGGMEDVPESAEDNLRDITKKLAAVDREQREQREYRGASPERQRYGNYSAKMVTPSADVYEGNDSDSMREQTVRLTMQTLARNSK